MSFCNDIKNEISKLRPPKYCRYPLLYGFLLFGRSFSYKKISLQTSNKEVAENYKSLVFELYNAEVKITEGGEKRPTYKAEVISETDRLKILADFDFGIYDGAINRDLLTDDASVAYFIRGAFLACGNISDPDKEYRADFEVKTQAAADDLQKLLGEHYITAAVSKRGTGFVVYMRRSEMITNLMTLIGLSDRSLQLIETTIVKSVKNNINRARNCDDANISKTVEASIRQRTAIEFLEKTGKFEMLPESLYAAAVLRKNNPEASLHELCKLSREPITVSGLNHRFRKIIEIYEESKK